MATSPFGRIGVFGSLCNPPHLGHLVLCAEAAWQLRLERVVIVPTGAPPHRNPPAESPEVRLRLALALASCDEKLSVSRVEVDRPGPSYMSDTLRALQLRHAGNELVLLLGADQLASLARWHEAERIPELARIAVAPRPGMALAGIDRAHVEQIEMPAIGIASSEIRDRVRRGRPIRHLVPDPVRLVIERERLYQAPQERSAAPERREPPGPTGLLAWDEPPDPETSR
jgi:nicotinate-nucleotide adenylyltransferase